MSAPEILVLLVTIFAGGFGTGFAVRAQISRKRRQRFRQLQPL